MVTAAEGRKLDKQVHQAGLSLLFSAGRRPSADDIERLLSSTEMTGAGARISYRPEQQEGWVELLTSGLTFDLTGLAPAESAPLPPRGHSFGLDAHAMTRPLEAISLIPGHHIVGGIAVMPVVRAMAGLAANIALPFNVAAVCWHPAQSWMEPQYFARIVLNWLAGGAFPALGLTAVAELGDRSVESRGLAFFIGQEIELEALQGESSADTVKLAVRLIDYMVRNGPLKEPRQLEGPGGEPLQAVPSRSGHRVSVWRGS